MKNQDSKKPVRGLSKFQPSFRMSKGDFLLEIVLAKGSRTITASDIRARKKRIERWRKRKAA